VITLVGASVFMFSVGHLDTFAKLASAGMVMWAIVNCGGLFEQRNWVYVLEWVRLMVSGIVLGYLFRSSGQFEWLAIGLAAFCLVSSVWLYRLRKLWMNASRRVLA